jgi:hypothetical protein
MRSSERNILVSPHPEKIAIATPIKCHILVIRIRHVLPVDFIGRKASRKEDRENGEQNACSLSNRLIKRDPISSSIHTPVDSGSWSQRDVYSASSHTLIIVRVLIRQSREIICQGPARISSNNPVVVWGRSDEWRRWIRIIEGRGIERGTS